MRIEYAAPGLKKDLASDALISTLGQPAATGALPRQMWMARVTPLMPSNTGLSISASATNSAAMSWPHASNAARPGVGP
jgi:hypothetical protein